MTDRLTTVVSVAGVEASAARAAAPRLLRRLREERRVVSADATWDGATGRLVVTIGAEVDGPASDIDEAYNFDRVWRCAIATLGGDAGGVAVRHRGVDLTRSSDGVLPTTRDWGLRKLPFMPKLKRG